MRKSKQQHVRKCIGPHGWSIGWFQSSPNSSRVSNSLALGPARYNVLCTKLTVAKQQRHKLVVVKTPGSVVY